MHYVKGEAKDAAQPNEGFEQLLAMLPDEARDFADTLSAQPAAMAYFGQRADAERLRRKADELRTARPENMCETAMAMAEVIEANQPDCEQYFITDAATRGHVFSGAKWKAGWVFLMGAGPHDELAARFKEKDFLAFAQNGAALDVVDLGPRETAAVYFLQLMARYAMTWGRIEPGDDHEMGHFLEADMPGVVVGHGSLTPVEELLLLALMKMGAPAVVPPDYAWGLGRQVRAAGSGEILEAAVRFPNLRIREVEGERIELPDFCDPAHASEDFEACGSVGGDGSFLVLMPAEAEDGVELAAGDDSLASGPVGITIEVGDERLDMVTSAYIEDRALDCIAMIRGLRAERTENGGLVIHHARQAAVLASRIAEALAAGLKYNFPLLKKVHVEVLTDTAEVLRARERADRFRAERDEAVAAETDETVPCFHYCIECQPFSKEHVCIITPDRPPMCGRNPFQIRTAALFGATWHPYVRREIEGAPLREVIPVGAPLNAQTGEYAAVNETVHKLTGGAVKRVSLHSVRECPHTNCGCFQFVAFWMQEENGIGIMERGYGGEAPGGITWDHLANAAGGKQGDGVVGISGAYLKSSKFLQGDGGRAAIRWLSPKAREILEEVPGVES